MSSEINSGLFFIPMSINISTRPRTVAEGLFLLAVVCNHDAMKYVMYARILKSRIKSGLNQPPQLTSQNAVVIIV